MYRESDAECSGPDQAPEDEKTQKFRERWECLSKESSEQVCCCLKALHCYGKEVDCTYMLIYKCL